MQIYPSKHDASAFQKKSGDLKHLIAECLEEQERERWLWRRCASSCVFLLFLLSVTMNAIAVYIIYFKHNPHSCVPIKVMALNCWGRPESQFKAERMQAIAAVVSKAKHDIYLLEELWLERDHSTIRESLPKGYTMTEFRALGPML